MKMISYAQNFEDVILWRALEHIKNGFYVDVGAAWPTLHSVTKVFYDSGWKGINIEPNPDFISEYHIERPRDINLQVAVSNEAGEERMNFISDTGLSTMSDEITEVHSEQGYTSTPEIVKVTTLNIIFEEYTKDINDIHFLKVDVEGLEPQVINSCNWLKYRPWIIVVEATVPLSQETKHYEWESSLLSASYHFVYLDGLNRFYVADEHSELDSAFASPPNCFDEFMLYSEYLKAEEVSELSFTNSELLKKLSESHETERRLVVEIKDLAGRKNDESRDELNEWLTLNEFRRELKKSKKSEKQLLKEIDKKNHEVWAYQNQIAIIHSSKFWKVGMPLRIGIKYSGKLFRFIKYFDKNESPKALIRFFILELSRFPKFKKLLKKVVIKSFLNNFFARLVYESIKPPVVHEASILSKRAQVIKSRIESSDFYLNKNDKGQS